MKAILILEMPKYCEDCPCSFYDRWDLNLNLICSPTKEDVNSGGKPDWCPLKPMPQRANNPDLCDAGRYDKGYNDCIDEILGEGK